MFFFIIKRIAATIPVMAVVALFVFLMLRLSPGDPAAVIAGDYASPEDIAKIRTQLGLDQPIIVQFSTWVWSLMQGNLGISIFSNLPVTKLIAQRLEPTLMLSLTTLIFAMVVAVPIGVIAAWKAGTWVDRLIMVFAVFGFSVPVFVLGYMMIFSFSMELGILPVQGYKSPFDDLWQFVRHITLPTITLSVIYIALIARITRASMLEVLEEDYIRTARAKGQTESRVLISHALKNASLPVVTIIGLMFGTLLGGAVITETIFTWPGEGLLTIQAIKNRDYTLVQASVLLVSVSFVFINLLVDILYTILDPRIKYTNS